MNKPKLIRITTIPLSLFSLLKGQLKFMKSYFDVLGVSSDGPYIDNVRENEGVKIETVEMTRKISPIKDLKAVWSLYKIFKKEKPLIVHTHTPKAGTTGMLAAKLAGVPYRLHTIAGLPLLEVTGKKRTLLDLVEKATYACATNIYPNSFELKEIILKNKYTSPEKLKVIGNGSSNGIDTKHFDPELFPKENLNDLKRELNITESNFVFVFIGRLVGDKGINEMIEAFEQLPPTLNAKLILVGPFEAELDPLKPVTLKAIQENTNIISCGFQKDVRPYFAISDVLLFPSYREGFPNVVMQAGAMGLASIVSNINGCNEIIVEGENGLIIPVKSSGALLEAMMKLVNNEPLFQKLKSNSRRMIVERYDQQLVWEAILNEYRLITGEELISN